LLVQPAPQVFDVSLPVMVNGTSAPGAGNLETTASEDDYAFTTTAAGAIQVDLSSCTSSLGYYVSWSLVNAQTGLPLYSTSACASKLVTGVPAGQYRLVVTRNGAVGTYNVGILVQPPTQVFAVSLPASISNGVPSSGAGNLETTASEDDYTLTTAAAGTLTLGRDRVLDVGVLDEDHQRARRRAVPRRRDAQRGERYLHARTEPGSIASATLPVGDA